MASKKKKAAGLASNVADRNRVYVERLVSDGDLRDNLQDGYQSLIKAYGRVANGKDPGKVVLNDKKFKKELGNAINSLRDAGGSLSNAPKKRKSGAKKVRRVLVLGVVGGVAALALSEGLRNKVLDKLFGAEEEFEYTSTTTPPAPAATTPA